MYNISLVKKFSLLLLVSIVLFGFTLGKVISSCMRQNMITRSNDITVNFLQHEIKSHFKINQLNTNEPIEQYKELSRSIAALSLGPDVAIMQVRVWDNEGNVVWSSSDEKVGNMKNAGNQGHRAVFQENTSRTTSPAHQLNVRFADHNKVRDMMEFIIPVNLGSQKDIDLVFEIYAGVEGLMTDIDHHNSIVWLSILVGSILLYLLLFSLFCGASRRIEQQSEEINLSEERFRNLIQSAQEAIVSADKSGRIVLMNEAAELIFGYTVAEARGSHFSSLFVPAGNGKFDEHLDQFFKEGECLGVGRNFESTGVRKDGETFPLEVSLSVSGDKGNCMLTGLVRDISQRNNLYGQLESAKEEWEECFDIINDAITIHDNDFNIIRANKAAETMLGQPLEDILSKKCFQSYHGKTGPPNLCPSCETLKTGIPSTSEVFEQHLNKHLEVKALPRLDENNQVIGVVHVVRDITDRKKAEEKQLKLQTQLNHIQKMESIGRLAGGIAHDFNNLLSAIIGYSELALRDIPQDTKLARDIKTIKDAGDKAAILTSQLLAFSRKQVLNMRPIDLNKVVTDLNRIMARVIGEDITLDLHLSSKIGVVVGDPGQIEQVLLNLAVNARDAMPKGGHCIIETSMVEIEQEYVDQHAEAQLGPHALLAFTDTGSGITKDVRKQIFDPFFTTKEVGKGTGLGLATVYGIIKQHGGQIYVYSEPNKGTTFKIYLPVTPNMVIESSDSVPDTLPTGHETILLAEDDSSVRKMIQTFLEPIGYTVLTAENGHKAIELSQAHHGKIDLLLTDVIMPNINGQELADTLAKTRPEMKVIFMSGYTDDAIVHHGVTEKEVNFIQKPITLTRLARKLRDVLEG